MMTDTQIHRATKGVRARYTLPLEMLLYSSMLLDAVSGSGLVRGRLWEQLFLYGELSGSTPLWVVMLGPVAICGLAFSLFEWFGGRNWCDKSLLRACRIRSLIALGGIVAAAYQSWTLLLLVPEGGMIFTVAWSGLLEIPFFAWVWASARRAAVVLDGRYRTVGLEAEYARDRAKW